MNARWLALALVVVPGFAAADEFDGEQALTTDQIAKIKADREIKKQDAIDADKGDDTFDGIHAAKKKIRESLDESLEENGGVSKLKYLKALNGADRDQKREIADKVKAIKEKTKADREAKAKQEADDAEHPRHADAEADPKPPVESESGPEVVKGYKDGESMTIPSKVDANGEKTPEIILGFDEAHSPAATAPQKSEGEAAPAPTDPAP
jgi:hypothetical protein